MAIQFPDFQRISFDEANPMLVGAERGQKFMQNAIQFPQDMQAKILANQIAQVQAKYADPMAKEGLTAAQQQNQWNPKIWASGIGLQGAQATNLGAETDKTRYMLQHPGFLGGDETKSMEALRQMGLVNEHYQQIIQPQAQQQQPPMQQPSMQQTPMQPPQQQQPQVGMGGFTPIAGNPQAEQMAQRQQTVAQASQIAQAIQKQQQAMNIPQSQVNTGQGTPNGQGFNVNSLVQALIQKPMTDLQYKQTLTKVMNQNLMGKPFTSMPTVEKEYAISQARGMGYTGEQASKMFNQGYDLSSMAQAKGYDPDNPSSWPTAKGAPTTAIQTRIQRANSTLAALDAVEPILASSTAYYSPRLANISPKLMQDMVTGENPDKQSDAFAAYALYPEIQALRINAQGGNVGEGAIQHMADASYSRLNTLGISPNSYVYQQTMKKVQQLIKKMNHAENTAIYGQANRSYEADDEANARNSDLASMSVEELKKIAEGK